MGSRTREKFSRLSFSVRWGCPARPAGQHQRTGSDTSQWNIGTRTDRTPDDRTPDHDRTTTGPESLEQPNRTGAYFRTGHRTALGEGKHRTGRTDRTPRVRMSGSADERSGPKSLRPKNRDLAQKGPVHRTGHCTG